MRSPSCAFLKWSYWKRGEPSSDLFGATRAALLSECTTAEVREVTDHEPADLISRRSRGGFCDPDAQAWTVSRSLPSPYRIDPQTEKMVP